MEMMICAPSGPKKASRLCPNLESIEGTRPIATLMIVCTHDDKQNGRVLPQGSTYLIAWPNGPPYITS